MKKKPMNNAQLAIKNKSLDNTLKTSGQKTRIKGHMKATNQRKQAKRDSRA